LRQAVTHKEPLEHSAQPSHCGHLSSCATPAHKRVCSSRTVSGRIAASPHHYHQPLKVHRPHLVRRLTTSPTMQTDLPSPRPSPGPPLSQARSLQHPLETALRSPLDHKVADTIPGSCAAPSGKCVCFKRTISHTLPSPPKLQNCGAADAILPSVPLFPQRTSRSRHL